MNASGPFSHICIVHGEDTKLLYFFSDIAQNASFGVVDVLSGHFIGHEMHMMPLVSHIRKHERAGLNESLFFYCRKYRSI